MSADLVASLAAFAGIGLLALIAHAVEKARHRHDRRSLRQVIRDENLERIHAARYKRL
jgi:hypothetical protein